MMESWGVNVDPSEKCRRLLDLFLVSVLLDAGAGNSWSYKSKENGRTYRRSEGLAIASLEMFKAGIFSSNKTQPHQVDGEGLRTLTVEVMAKGLQISEQNPIAGLEWRTGLLIRLADALNNHALFGADARPGNMLGKVFFPISFFTDTSRLSDIPPDNPSLFRPHSRSSNSLVSPHGRPRSDLAPFTYNTRQHLSW